MFSISLYAMVSTQSSVFVFGGRTNDYDRISSILQYANDEWNIVGNLHQPRSSHSAVLIDSYIMVVGGWSNDDRP